jgi:transcriptional regulator with XRE-family HTH domain
MGQGKKQRPQKLGAKLTSIRASLGITQDEVAKRLKSLGADTTIHSGYIGDFETTDKREPGLLTLFAYSKLSGISVNLLIDDEVELPK